MRPRPLYRPSSPEGSEKDASYQPSFANLEQSQPKTDGIDQSQAKKPATMATRTSPYGAEADEDKGKGTKEGKGKASKNDKKEGDESKSDTESSQMRSKARKGPAQPETGRDDSRSSTGGLELNNSTIAALKFCNSSEGSKLSEMTSKELKSLSKTLARANIDDAQEIYKVLVNFINKKENAPEAVTENMQRLSEVFESAGGRKEFQGQQSGPQEGDPVTFYHSDTSCEVSPTDPKFRTMSSISSPPLDTSSPKSSGSSIGVQTDTHTTEQVSAIPTTLTTVASSQCEGVLVSTTVSVSSPAIGGQYNGGSNQTIPPKQFGRSSDQTSCTIPPPRGLAASPVPSTQYATITSQATPPGHPNLFPPTSISRTLTPDLQNNPVSIPSRRSFERTQSLTAVAISSVQAQQHAADKRHLTRSDPGIVNPLGTAPYRPEVPRYPAKGYQPPGIGEPSTIPGCPVETNAVGYQYYQITRTDQLDPRRGRSVSGTNHSVATLSQTGTTSGHVIPTQPHAICLPQQANTEGSREFLGPQQAIATQMPFSNHAVPVSSYPAAHEFPRNGCGISDSKHPSHAAFRPVQTGQGINSIPPPRQASAGFSIPRASGNILAQSCPAFGDSRLTSEEYPGFGLRTVQPGVPSVAEKTHTISGAYQNRYKAPSAFQESKPKSAPHSTQNVFNYQDEEFRVVGDVYNQDGMHTRRPRGSTGPLQRQVRFGCFYRNIPYQHAQGR